MKSTCISHVKNVDMKKVAGVLEIWSNVPRIDSFTNSMCNCLAPGSWISFSCEMFSRDMIKASRCTLVKRKHSWWCRSSILLLTTSSKRDHVGRANLFLFQWAWKCMQSTLQHNRHYLKLQIIATESVQTFRSQSFQVLYHQAWSQTKHRRNRCWKWAYLMASLPSFTHFPFTGTYPFLQRQPPWGEPSCSASSPNWVNARNH